MSFKLQKDSLVLQEKTIPGLTLDGCRKRQQRLIAQLQKSKIDAALIADRRHVYYFSGYWPATHHAPTLLISADGMVLANLPEIALDIEVAADEVLYYQPEKLGTLIEDQWTASLGEFDKQLQAVELLGFDLPHIPRLLNQDAFDLSPVLLELRRAKLEDEVDLIRCAIRGCEAAYAHAAQLLKPGIREIDVYAEMQAAAVKEIGEPLGEMGNDFQAGTPGGPPRTRTVQAGELMPLDVAISVRGYRCDLCRTFAVDGEPTAIQEEAAEKVQDALISVEKQAHVGASCRQLYEDVFQQLDGYRGWDFPHHLGHGTGLNTHEAPRLNPNWDDTLSIGDLFTVEPGLYHEELRAGVRIEQNYWLSENGLERLSSYPTGLC